MTTTSTMTSTTTSTEILHHTTTFITEILTKSDLRHQLFGVFRQRTQAIDPKTLKLLVIATETLENAISSTSSTIRSSSLRLAEKLVSSANPRNAFSSFLLSLIYSLRNQTINASVSLLDVFYYDPLLARSEIAPVLFEDLFLLHMVPVIQSLNDQRTSILSSISPDLSHGSGKLMARSISASGLRFLSRMSEDQALKLKEVEMEYEDVLDENIRVFVGYLKEILEDDSNGNRSGSPPQLIFKRSSSEGVRLRSDAEEKIITTEELAFGNGRYNPMWGEGEERSVESYSRSSSYNSKSPRVYPQRVSPRFFTEQKNTTRLRPSSKSHSEADAEMSSGSISSDSSSSSGLKIEKLENIKVASLELNQMQFQKQKKPVPAESSCSSDPPMEEDPENLLDGEKSTPPKDFVCPITSNIFVDPVTLETGQTYERKAIQEWVGRGNSTCPITRQKLQSTQLPKTNYVLKRLIASWQEQYPEVIQIQVENPLPKTGEVYNSVRPLSSPTSVISQASIDGSTSKLPLAITNLCMSEILSESETAVLRIERFWQEADKEEIQSMLSKPAVINGFVEILLNSVDPQVLRATVFLLSELGSKDKLVIQTLTRVESDVNCIVSLFKNGLMEAVVLIYMLRPSTENLIEMDLVESLLMVIKMKEGDLAELCMQPRTASMFLLAQILQNGEDSHVSTVVHAVISANAIVSVVKSLEVELIEERIAAVGILLKCMLEDGKCRNVIADKAELAPILESFMRANDDERFEIVHFLSELVKLNRRAFNTQLLHIIKDEGAFSTMHTLLIYLQTAQQDQCPVVAGLLLQLDILVEPRKMSMYREEAIDALIACLRSSDFPGTQIRAAETILALQGRFSYSGNPLGRAFLLKRTGLDKRYTTLMRTDQLGHISGKFEENLEEEKEADEWERKMAFALVSHEFGLLFEALAEGLKSRYTDLSSTCFVSATWLTNMLAALPDTGVRGAARVCLLKQFISIFKSARDTEDRALAMLALNSFIHDPEGLRDLTPYVKDMLKGLRELRKSSVLASEMLKVFSKGQDSSNCLWNHKDLIQVDCSSNGAVLSVACFRDKIFSGHSDGTLKVWSGKSNLLHVIQETREHTKAITSMVVLQSGEKLYSGSLDKTTRVWSIGNEGIHCVQVHDIKDQVQDIVVSNTISCFIPHGPGVKLHSWNGESKLLNPNKHVKCLALVQGKLYCGCNDGSIQEIDLATETLTTIQTGTKKLLSKTIPIYAVQVHQGLIYSASSGLDGAAVKIWSTSNFSAVGSLPSSMDVRSMVVTSELIYLGCKTGAVEIWCKEKHTKVETLQTGTNTKITCMAVDSDEEVLVIGTWDGRIQAWGVN